MKNKIILCTLLAIFSFSCCFSAEINTSGPPISPIGAKLFGKSSAGSVGWIKSVDTVVPVVGVSPAADTAAINAALLGGNKHVLITGDATISSSLVIYSNTFLEVKPGATITQPDGNSTKLLINKAYLDGTGRDHNIKISGEFYRGTSAGGSAEDKHSISLHYINGLTLEDLKISTMSGNKYGVFVSDVNTLVIRRASSPSGTASDFIHITGPAENVTVEDISCQSGDDAVAFTAVDYPAYSLTSGDITNIKIRNVSANTSHSVVKVIGGTGAKVRGVDIRNISGSAAVGINLFADPICGPSDISDVNVDGVRVDISEYPSSGRIILATTLNGGTLSIKNVMLQSEITSSQFVFDIGSWSTVSIDTISSKFLLGGSLIRSISGSAIGKLIVRNLLLDDVQSSLVDFYGTVSQFIASNAAYSGGSTSAGILAHYASGSNVSSSLISDVSTLSTRCLMQSENGSTSGKWGLSNIYLKNTNRIFNMAANGDATITNLTADSLVNAAIYVSGGATVTVRGAGVHRVTPWNGFQRAGSEIIHCANRDFPADLALLTGAAGDECLATAGTLTPATLPARVVHNGTAWKSLLNLP